jgi:hypothetical protein
MIPSGIRALCRPLWPCRVETVKLKINGRCVNRCAFCLFHSDPHLLEVADVVRVLDWLGTPRLAAIIVNGGEPTLHPRFAEITGYLRQRCKGRSPLYLGTNLIPLDRSPVKRAALWDGILAAYDRIEVGCDDEHRNIDALERFAPEIVGAGIRLHVNVVDDYCSPATRARILAVRDRHGATVSLSAVHHLYRTRPVLATGRGPCRKRTRDLLVNCNRDVFFCYHQEVEAPLFNLARVTPAEWDYYVWRHDPGAYRFCACCTEYERQSALAGWLAQAAAAVRWRQGLRVPPGAVKTSARRLRDPTVAI